jgi:hypothetical protein
MKIYFLITVLFSFLINCYDVKEDLSLLKTPNASLLLNYVLYPKNNFNFLSFNSKDLPGIPRSLLKVNSTTYSLIENDTNSNILTLYQSTDGLNFSSTGYSFDSLLLTGNKNNLYFISNTLYYISTSSSIFNFNPYSYLTYTTNTGWSGITTGNYNNAPNSSNQLNCIYYFNNKLFLSLESKIMSLDVTNGNLTDESSSPGYSGPRSNASCFVTNTSVYLSGGFRNSGGFSTNYTDFYKSDDGVTFVRKSTQTSLQGGSTIYGVQVNDKIILCSFACTSSINNGEIWSNILYININGSIVTSGLNPISLITDGEIVYLYSSNGKVYYGKL